MRANFQTRRRGMKKKIRTICPTCRAEFNVYSDDPETIPMRQVDFQPGLARVKIFCPFCKLGFYVYSSDRLTYSSRFWIRRGSNVPVKRTIFLICPKCREFYKCIMKVKIRQPENVRFICLKCNAKFIRNVAEPKLLFPEIAGKKSQISA